VSDYSDATPEEEEVIADEIIRGVKTRIARSPVIWRKSIRRGIDLEVHKWVNREGKSYYEWVLRDRAGAVVGGGVLRDEGYEVIAEEAGFYEQWRGKGLFRDVLRAFVGRFGEVCTEELGTVSRAAQRSLVAVGGRKEPTVEGLMRYCVGAGKAVR